VTRPDGTVALADREVGELMWRRGHRTERPRPDGASSFACVAGFVGVINADPHRIDSAICRPPILISSPDWAGTVTESRRPRPRAVRWPGNEGAGPAAGQAAGGDGMHQMPAQAQHD
jgi:hypothetical protein